MKPASARCRRSTAHPRPTAPGSGRKDIPFPAGLDNTACTAFLRPRRKYRYLRLAEDLGSHIPSNRRRSTGPSSHPGCAQRTLQPEERPPPPEYSQSPLRTPARQIRRRRGCNREECAALLPEGGPAPAHRGRRTARSLRIGPCPALRRRDSGTDPKVPSHHETKEDGTPATGTADCIQIAESVLWVTDYKNGAGVPVEADHNPQMMTYALGALAMAALQAKSDTQETLMQALKARIEKARRS